MPLFAGQILQARYRILGLVGQGGMGAVYQAEDLRLGGSRRAIKESIPDQNASMQALLQVRQQFQTEARVLAYLNHPNLPKVSDYFSDGGNEYLVMEYVEGENLADILARHIGPLSEKPVLIWIDQVLDALDYLHNQPQPIIHRDIKPSNIILTPQGKAELVDFGLVKLFDPTNPRTATAMKGLGTPQYAPLEQYSSGAGHTDARSDVYSLGATLYHLLTNVSPPDATQRVLNPSKLVPPRQINAGISAGTETAILKALEIHPGQRYQSAREMRAALQGSSVPALPATAVPVVRRPSRSAWTWIATAAGVLLVALMAWQVRRAVVQATPPPPETAVMREVTISAITAVLPTETWTPTSSETPTPSPETPPSPIADATAGARSSEITAEVLSQQLATADAEKIQSTRLAEASAIQAGSLQATAQALAQQATAQAQSSQATTVALAQQATAQAAQQAETTAQALSLQATTVALAQQATAQAAQQAEATAQALSLQATAIALTQQATAQAAAEATQQAEAGLAAVTRPAAHGRVLASQLNGIVLDGTPNEWPQAWLPLTTVVEGQDNWTDRTDLSGTFQVAWSQAGLYLAVRITDDIYRAGPDGTDMWKGDSLEINFDRALVEDFTSAASSDDDFQIGIGFGPELSQVRAYRWLPFALESAPDAIGTAVSTPDGYTVEAFLPWSAVTLTTAELAPGRSFGFNLALNDNDAYEYAQQTVVASSPARLTYNNPTQWGTLTLQ